jgi:hypothetical protein
VRAHRQVETVEASSNLIERKNALVGSLRIATHGGPEKCDTGNDPVRKIAMSVSVFANMLLQIRIANFALAAASAPSWTSGFGQWAHRG